jgi:hypothetical protein
MAKAKFHKSQRVFVKPVGTWAFVESVVPKWIKGCDEPFKITYDCGMGREFTQEELEEESLTPQNGSLEAAEGAWRVLRAKNRWKSAEQCRHHPFPGTHPTVVTTGCEWGGWRVPGSEYDLDPRRIERQAQVIVRAPALVKVIEEFLRHSDQEPENLSDEMTQLAQMARRIISEVSS